MTRNVQQLMTEHIDLWTSAIENKSSAGRGNSRKKTLYGIKKLRELILELAVRGKLVEQDPNDEPASALLKRIAAERGRLVEAGEVKKPKKLPKVSEEEKTFELPEGWDLCRLGNALNVINGRAYKKNEMLQEGTPLLRVGNLFTSKEWYYSNLELDPDKYIDNGDLIYAWSASFGPFIWNGNKVIYHYHIWKLDFYAPQSLYKPFIYNFLLSITKKIKESGNGIAMLHMTKERMEKLILRIPPLAEQHRIVAKVDELMALCDQLEQQTEQQLDAHQLLVDTLLGTLTQSQNANELADNWTRLSQHFDTLFTTEASIDQLKQTILQLAVMGKLVPQNPNDEPASELLKRIAVEKEQLIKDKKIKKQKPLPPISEEEKPFELPEGWEWVRLEDLTLHASAGWSPQCEGSPRETDQWGVLKVSAVTWGEYRPSENKALPLSLASRPQYEVKAGDFLISRANTADLVARAVIVPESCPNKLMMSDKIIRFQFSDIIYSEFVNLNNNSHFSREYYARVAGGTSSSMKNVTQSQVRNLLVPLPCLLEQHRIVTKTNELFTLCDLLKERLQHKQQTQLLLTDTLVQEALA